MTLATLAPVAAACLAFYVAVLCLRFARAPGWGEQRWFALVAVTGAAYCLLELFSTSPVGPEGLGWAVRAQVLLAGINVFGWLRYSAAMVKKVPTRWDRLAWVAAPALGVLGLVPGLYFTGGVTVHRLAPFDTPYFDAIATRLGGAAWLALCFGLTLVLARFVRGWKNGVPYAPALTLASSVMVLTGANDAGVGLHLWSTPYLLSLGFIVPIAAVGLVLTSRFVDEVKALEQLEDSLEAFIAERTNELIATQKALLQAEKLAALGQLAGGVAHEVNNPAASVIANLRYLADAARSGPLPDDAREALDESLTSMDRITQVVRQLLLAGRMSAGYAPELSPVELHPSVDEAIGLARARCGPRGQVVNELPPGLAAMAQEQALVQVFTNLVSNALEAVAAEREVTVRVSAAPVGDEVEVKVEDDGAGMTAETLSHLFEPFFSTKPFGKGTGLGLAVSKGLVAGLGGTLRFTSELGRGTCAHLLLRRVDLPASPPAKEEPPEAQAEAAPGPLPRALLIDDDPAVRDALRRGLSRHFALTLSEGVSHALALLEQGQAYDLLLCDLMMPEGGGEAFWEQLGARWPALKGRVVFITGGATDERSRTFVAQQRQPVLTKPIETARLVELARTLGQLG